MLKFYERDVLASHIIEEYQRELVEMKDEYYIFICNLKLGTCLRQVSYRHDVPMPYCRNEEKFYYAEEEPCYYV
jgi:hypothetical protein